MLLVIRVRTVKIVYFIQSIYHKLKMSVQSKVTTYTCKTFEKHLSIAFLKIICRV